jgi:hypothetical protein
MTAGLLQIHHKAVIEFAGVARRRAGIKNVARDNNHIHLLFFGGFQQPVKKRGVFRGPAFTVKVLTQVPVRGVKKAHNDPMAKKREADYKR